MEIPFQIIFSILLVILLISSSLYLFSILKEEESEKRVFTNFNELVEEFKNLCFSFPGTKREIKFLINEKTIAIFFTNNIENFDLNEIIKKVKNSEKSEGDFICIIYKNKRPYCEKLPCKVLYKYIGYEAKESFLDFFVKSLYGLKEIEDIKVAEKFKDFINISK
jgi:hypothetical protein